MNRNTLLCIDLKTWLQKDDLLRAGRPYKGEIMLDGDDHVTFVEQAHCKPEKRNVQVANGEYTTVTLRLKDGRKRAYFKQLPPLGDEASINAFVIAVAEELRKSFLGLIEEEGNEE